MSVFSGLASTFIKDAKWFKSEILKVVSKAPSIVATIEKDAPEIEALMALAFPGAAALEAAAIAVVDAVGVAVQAAGTATAANGLSAASDKGVITAVEAVETLVKNMLKK